VSITWMKSALFSVPAWVVVGGAVAGLAGAMVWAYEALSDDPPADELARVREDKWRGGPARASGVDPFRSGGTPAGTAARAPGAVAVPVGDSPAQWSGVEDGRAVIYIQPVPGGDIIVVDPENGRMIEVRPAPKVKNR
jgi:hypothetical protein